MEVLEDDADAGAVVADGGQNGVFYAETGGHLFGEGVAA